MSARKLHILLADDETEIATLVSSVLVREGHTVDLADDGESALELLKESPARFDLIITDSNMPGISGIQLIEHLRKTAFPGKIILLSGYASDLDDEVRPLKVDRIIQKPFAFKAFVAAVKEVTAA